MRKRAKSVGRPKAASLHSKGNNGAPSDIDFDDSSSALDFATDAALRKALKENLNDTTVFLVSQRVNTVKNADKILVLDDGELVATGTHKELYKTMKCTATFVCHSFRKRRLPPYENTKRLIKYISPFKSNLFGAIFPHLSALRCRLWYPFSSVKA